MTTGFKHHSVSKLVATSLVIVILAAAKKKAGTMEHPVNRLFEEGDLVRSTYNGRIGVVNKTYYASNYPSCAVHWSDHGAFRGIVDPTIERRVTLCISYVNTYYLRRIEPLWNQLCAVEE